VLLALSSELAHDEAKHGPGRANRRNETARQQEKGGKVVHKRISNLDPGGFAPRLR